MKLETHIHTSEHSACSLVNAAGAVLRCVKLGYDGMVITNHFCNDGWPKKMSWENRIDQFMRGYDAAREAAPENFAVILGMELRFFHENENDYLIYGLDEAFLYEHPNFDDLGLEKFSIFAKKHDLLVCQAHPFRFGMEVVRPEYVDAIEVYNGHAGHAAHNSMAKAWCEMHGKIALSGSDYHGGDSGDGVKLGGIVLQEPVRDGKALVRAMRAGKFELLK